MIAVDTNILVYAFNRDSGWHAAAAAAMTTLAEDFERWAIPWPCVHEFLAVASQPRIFDGASTAAAIGQLELWMGSPSIRIVGETASHWSELKAMIQRGRLSGGAVHDARIAAICREHGVRELWSADRDFTRIPGVRVRNPLIAEG